MEGEGRGSVSTRGDMSFRVGSYLATDSASIAARLGAYRAFCLGRSGLLDLLLLWWNRRD
jgi:hypothetical protein